MVTHYPQREGLSARRAIRGPSEGPPDARSQLKSHVIALCALALLGGCALLEDAIEDQLPPLDAAPEVPPGGDDDGNGGLPDEDPVTINSVQPNRGVSLGGVTVEIVGTGFTENSQVTFGVEGLDCTGLEWLSENRIRCVTPAHERGQVTVRVTEPSENFTALLQNGFEYFDPVTASSLTPGRGPSDGGTELTITGTGFIENTTVRFGVSEPVEATVTGPSNLVVTTPALGRGVFGVTVANTNGSYTLPAAFSTFDPVDVSLVTPIAGALAGGTAVTVAGSGLIPGTTLYFGDQVETATPNGAETSLSGTTLPAPEGTLEGPIDVGVANENGEAVLRDGFVYVDTADTDPRIIAILPPAGMVSGGGKVQIVGVGLSDGVTVDIGSTEADCDVPESDNVVSCTVPSAGEGTVDVAVSIGGAPPVILDDAFTYVDLRLFIADPDEGSIAGGTYVTLVGHGFADDAEIFFDAKRATDVVVQDGEQLTLYTPSGSVGPSSLRVRTRGLEITVPGLYGYFDPSDLEHWTSGGHVEGAVNVTVLDGDTGELVKDAFVMLGAETDPLAPHEYGFTDARGQVTLSGPDVFGPQSVHATKDGYGGFSWVDTDARNLTLALSAPPPPPPDPLPECPQPEGGGFLPVVRGKVLRIKDEFNTGNDTVLVTTSYVSFQVPLPDPGPKAQLLSQGDYEAFVRPGDLVMIAEAGQIGPDGLLDVRTMGFRPFVYTEVGSGEECAADDTCPADERCWKAEPTDDGGFCTHIYEGVNIVIDTPLNHDMQIDFPNAPLGLGPFMDDYSPPDTASAFVWLDFASMGLWPMGSDYGFTNSLLVRMFKQFPAHMADVAVFNVAGDIVGTGPAGDQTWSSTGDYGLKNPREPVVLEPILRAFRELQPELFGVVSDPVPVTFEQLPLESPVPLPTGVIHYLYNFEQVPVCIHPVFGVIEVSQPVIEWWAMSPGTTTTFALPKLPPALASARIPLGTHNFMMLGLYAPNADYDNLSMNELFDYQSQSGRLIGFTVTQQPE